MNTTEESYGKRASPYLVGQTTRSHVDSILLCSKRRKFDRSSVGESPNIQSNQNSRRADLLAKFDLEAQLREVDKEREVLVGTFKTTAKAQLKTFETQINDLMRKRETLIQTIEDFKKQKNRDNVGSFDDDAWRNMHHYGYTGDNYEGTFG